MDFKKLKERLANLDTACIFDVNAKLRVMDPEIRPINQGLKMIGIARIVHCKGDFLSVLKALKEKAGRDSRRWCLPRCERDTQYQFSCLLPVYYSKGGNIL
jgi:hypothetical protein